MKTIDTIQQQPHNSQTTAKLLEAGNPICVSFFFFATVSVNLYVLETIMSALTWKLLLLGVDDDMSFLLMDYMWAFNIPPLVSYVYRRGGYGVYLGAWFPMGSPAILTVCWALPVFWYDVRLTT